MTFIIVREVYAADYISVKTSRAERTNIELFCGRFNSVHGIEGFDKFEVVPLPDKVLSEFINFALWQLN